jgi:cytochrome b561
MKKNVVSLSIAFIFLTMAVTGILLYIKQKAHVIEMSHTVFGLLFVLLASFHLYNNWKSIKSYSVQKQKSSLTKEVVYIFLTFAVVITLSLSGVLEPIAEFGKIFAKPKKQSETSIDFVEKSTIQNKTGKEMTLVIQKDEKSIGASLVVDVVDSLDVVVENLYSSDSTQEGPTPNLILSGKVLTTPPFTLRIIAIGKESADTLKSNISNLDAGLFQSIDTKNRGFKRVYLEVKK